MLHYRQKKRVRKTKKKTKSKNSFNSVKKKRNIPNLRLRLKLRKMLFVSLGIIFAGVILFWGGTSIVNLVRKSHVPGKDTFASCPEVFTSIKTKPIYGVVIKKDGETIKELILTAPDGATGLKKITLPYNSWMIVYFSSNFSYTQVDRFLYLSLLETGEISPCYVLEQVSLSSGVPIEYAIVQDVDGTIQSTLTLNEVDQMLSRVDSAEDYRFDDELLPLYLLGDKTEVSVITYAAFLEQFPDFFKITEIANEQAFIEVYNVTSIPGYASIVAKRWEMLGIDVSRVGNASHPEEEGVDAVIYVKDPELYSRTLGMIKGSFDPDRVKVVEGRPGSVVSTGDIVVFLLNR